MISRQGQISKIDGSKLHISFTQSSMCAHCQVKENCVSLSQQKRELTTTVPNPKEYHVGETVEIGLTVATSTYALILGYGFPLVTLLAISYICHLLKLSDNTNALCSVLGVIIYYIWLGKCQKKLEKNFQISIRKITPKTKTGCNS